MNSRHFIDTDYRKLQAFFVQIRASASQAACLHYGDLAWRIGHPIDGLVDIENGVRVWDSEKGEILGLAFWTGKDEVDLIIPKDELGGQMSDEMLVWMNERTRELELDSVKTTSADNDEEKERFLSATGFERVPHEDDVWMERGQEVDPPTFDLPGGYEIRTVADDPEITSGNGRSIYADNENERIRNKPGYTSDLDVKVKHMTDGIVSGCICWYDDLGKCAILEPVGTRDDHAGQGLASAVMARTIQNLRSYDAATLYVKTGKRNQAAVRAYQRVGFTIAGDVFNWRKPVR